MPVSNSGSDVALKVTLEKVFGFTEFRGQQRAVIDSLMGGSSALLLMPTGLGKSLCYQLPARLFSEQGLGFTLVVSPLISLMKDQVDAARAKGLRATFINSSLTGAERAARYRGLARGDFELVYVTPERFRVPAFLESLKSGPPVALFAIDEAHCISSWGHDFRPDYSRLGEIRELIIRPQSGPGAGARGAPLTLALTATATPQVAADILSTLSLTGASVFNSGVDRPNLSLSVHDVHGMDEKIRSFVGYRHLMPGPAIVYFSLISTLREFSSSLSRLGFEFLTYHGQMNDKDRKRSQETFLKSQGGVILATPAFGLGVDKPDVRLVMHAEVPGSIEAYYQEVGRAGRDGAPSSCVLLFDEDDVSIQTDFMNWANPDPGFIRAVYNLIDRNLVRARQEGFDYLRTQMNFYNRRDFRVETAVGQLERWGSLEGRQPREWTPVESPPDEYLSQRDFDLRMKSQRQKLYQMTELAQMAEGCRMVTVSEYFGFSASPCGRCDLCLRQSGSP